MPAIRNSKPVKAEPSTAPATSPSPDFKVFPSKAPRSPSKKAPNKPWTGIELRRLWQHVLKHGAPGGESGWEGVIDGRSGAQCRSAWRYRVIPTIEAALEGKGKGE